MYVKVAETEPEAAERVTHEASVSAFQEQSDDEAVRVRLPDCAAEETTGAGSEMVKVQAGLTPAYRG